MTAPFTPQEMYFLNALYKRSFEANVLPNMLARCGLGEAEYASFVERGFVRLAANRIELTSSGRKAYRASKKLQPWR